ncbi:MAG: alpha/beta hydrolase [Gemmatimonadaceae bacterium]
MNGRGFALTAIAWTAALILAVPVALIALLWWRQERVVFQPSEPPFPDPGTTRRVLYEAGDGQNLFAFVVTSGEDTHANRTGLVAFHGNADLAVALIPWAVEIAHRTGRIVVLPEYRGYGGLYGEPTVEGARLDALAAVAMVHDSLGIPHANLAYYGHSLGSAIATELAAVAPPGVLLLESPFTSARDMARIIIARPVELVWRFISRVHYDTEQRVRTLDVPVWVVHGSRDLIVPTRMGRAVYDAAKVKGEMLIVDDAGHNDVAQTGDDTYWAWIEKALKTR